MGLGKSLTGLGLKKFKKPWACPKFFSTPGSGNFRNSTGVSLVFIAVACSSNIFSRILIWFIRLSKEKRNFPLVFNRRLQFFFVAAAYLLISDKLSNIQSIVRKTRDRISVHYLSPEWRSLDKIAKFVSTIQTTGARYANFMGRRLTFCTISVLKENLHVPFPFLMRLWRNGAAQSDLCNWSS